MRVLVLDLETAPCLAMAERVWGVDPSDPFAYERALEERRLETRGDSDFLKPFMHRVIAVGLVGMDLKAGVAHVERVVSVDEAELLRRVEAWLKGGPVLVTWNGLAFDLAVLRYRAIYHGLAMPNLNGPPGARHYERYEHRYGDQHVDLMDLLSGYGRSKPLSLVEAAALCNVPVKSGGGSRRILYLWRTAIASVPPDPVFLLAISAHVEEDVRATARIFLRWWASQGRAAWLDLQALDDQLAGTAVSAEAAA